jgi:hypothetical protein
MTSFIPSSLSASLKLALLRSEAMKGMDYSLPEEGYSESPQGYNENIQWQDGQIRIEYNQADSSRTLHRKAAGKKSGSVPIAVLAAHKAAAAGYSLTNALDMDHILGDVSAIIAGIVIDELRNEPVYIAGDNLPQYKGFEILTALTKSGDTIPLFFSKKTDSSKTGSDDKAVIEVLFHEEEIPATHPSQQSLFGEWQPGFYIIGYQLPLFHSEPAVPVYMRYVDKPWYEPPPPSTEELACGYISKFTRLLYRPDSSVLLIGCGGILVDFLISAGVHAICAMSSQPLPDEWQHFVDTHRDEFDCIICALADPDAEVAVQFFMDCVQLLKPGGWALLQSYSEVHLRAAGLDVPAGVLEKLYFEQNRITGNRLLRYCERPVPESRKLRIQSGLQDEGRYSVASIFP